MLALHSMVMPEVSFRPIHVEPSLAENTLHISWRKAHGVGIVEDATEEIPGRKRRPLAGVVDHEIMNKDESAHREHIRGASGQNR